MPIFDLPTQNIFDHLLICLNLYQHTKKLVNSICSFFKYIQEWTDALPKKCLWTFNFCEFLRTCKNEAVSSIYSWEIVDWKIQQSVWLRPFWPISQEKHFSQIYDLCRNTANNINFHYRTSQVKINDWMFLWIQKTLFLVNFSNFWREKSVFQKNLAIMNNFIRVSNIVPKFREI